MGIIKAYRFCGFWQLCLVSGQAPKHRDHALVPTWSQIFGSGSGCRRLFLALTGCRDPLLCQKTKFFQENNVSSMTQLFFIASQAR